MKVIKLLSICTLIIATQSTYSAAPGSVEGQIQQYKDKAVALRTKKASNPEERVKELAIRKAYFKDLTNFLKNTPALKECQDFTAEINGISLKKMELREFEISTNALKKSVPETLNEVKECLEASAAAK